MTGSLLREHGDSQFQALATLAVSSAQEQRAQGLLHGARAGGRS
jgi:hypothetical protein